jgi:hypothetical protein
MPHCPEPTKQNISDSEFTPKTKNNFRFHVKENASDVTDTFQSEAPLLWLARAPDQIQGQKTRQDHEVGKVSLVGILISTSLGFIA